MSPRGLALLALLLSALAVGGLALHIWATRAAEAQWWAQAIEEGRVC